MFNYRIFLQAVSIFFIPGLTNTMGSLNIIVEWSYLLSVIVSRAHHFIYSLCCYQVIHKPSPATVAYLVQQPVEGQIVCIDQPDVSVPPPLAGAPLADGTIVTEQPSVPHQSVAVNEYGQPMEVVEIIQSRPHHIPAPPARALQLQHSECHTSGVPPPVLANSVPRYPSIPACSSADSLVEIEIHHSSRRQISTLPPIEVSV